MHIDHVVNEQFNKFMNYFMNVKEYFEKAIEERNIALSKCYEIVKEVKRIIGKIEAQESQN